MIAFAIDLNLAPDFRDALQSAKRRSGERSPPLRSAGRQADSVSAKQ